MVLPCFSVDSSEDQSSVQPVLEQPVGTNDIFLHAGGILQYGANEGSGPMIYCATDHVNMEPWEVPQHSLSDFDNLNLYSNGKKSLEKDVTNTIVPIYNNKNDLDAASSLLQISNQPAMAWQPPSPTSVAARDTIIPMSNERLLSPLPYYMVPLEPVNTHPQPSELSSETPLAAKTDDSGDQVIKLTTGKRCSLIKPESIKLSGSPDKISESSSPKKNIVYVCQKVFTFLQTVDQQAAARIEKWVKTEEIKKYLIPDEKNENIYSDEAKLNLKYHLSFLKLKKFEKKLLKAETEGKESIHESFLPDLQTAINVYKKHLDGDEKYEPNSNTQSTIEIQVINDQCASVQAEVSQSGTAKQNDIPDTPVIDLTETDETSQQSASDENTTFQDEIEAEPHFPALNKETVLQDKVEETSQLPAQKRKTKLQDKMGMIPPFPASNEIRTPSDELTSMRTHTASPTNGWKEQTQSDRPTFLKSEEDRALGKTIKNASIKKNISTPAEENMAETTETSARIPPVTISFSRIKNGYIVSPARSEVLNNEKDKENSKNERASRSRCNIKSARSYSNSSTCSHVSRRSRSSSISISSRSSSNSSKNGKNSNRGRKTVNCKNRSYSRSSSSNSSSSYHSSSSSSSSSNSNSRSNGISSSSDSSMSSNNPSDGSDASVGKDDNNLVSRKRKRQSMMESVNSGIPLLSISSTKNIRISPKRALKRKRSLKEQKASGNHTEDVILSDSDTGDEDEKENSGIPLLHICSTKKKRISPKRALKRKRNLKEQKASGNHAGDVMLNESDAEEEDEADSLEGEKDMLNRSLERSASFLNKNMDSVSTYISKNSISYVEEADIQEQMQKGKPCELKPKFFKDFKINDKPKEKKNNSLNDFEKNNKRELKPLKGAQYENCRNVPYIPLIKVNFGDYGQCSSSSNNTNTQNTVTYPEEYVEEFVPLLNIIREAYRKNDLVSNEAVLKKSSYGDLFKKISIQSIGSGKVHSNLIIRSACNHNNDERIHKIMYGCVPKKYSEAMVHMTSEYIKCKKRAYGKKSKAISFFETELECVAATLWLLQSQDLEKWKNDLRNTRPKRLVAYSWHRLTFLVNLLKKSGDRSLIEENQSLMKVHEDLDLLANFAEPHFISKAFMMHLKKKFHIIHSALINISNKKSFANMRSLILEDFIPSWFSFFRTSKIHHFLSPYTIETAFSGSNLIRNLICRNLYENEFDVINEEFTRQTILKIDAVDRFGVCRGKGESKSKKTLFNGATIYIIFGKYIMSPRKINETFRLAVDSFINSILNRFQSFILHNYFMYSPLKVAVEHVLAFVREDTQKLGLAELTNGFFEPPLKRSICIGIKRALEKRLMVSFLKRKSGNITSNSYLKVEFPSVIELLKYSTSLMWQASVGMMVGFNDFHTDLKDKKDDVWVKLFTSSLNSFVDMHSVVSKNITSWDSIVDDFMEDEYIPSDVSEESEDLEYVEILSSDDDDDEDTFNSSGTEDEMMDSIKPPTRFKCKYPTTGLLSSPKKEIEYLHTEEITDSRFLLCVEPLEFSNREPKEPKSGIKNKKPLKKVKNINISCENKKSMNKSKNMVVACKDEKPLKKAKNADIACKNETPMIKMKNMDIACKNEKPLKKANNADIAGKNETPVMKAKNADIACKNETPMTKTKNTDIGCKNEKPLKKANNADIAGKNETPMMKAKNADIACKNETPMTKTKNTDIGCKNETPMIKAKNTDIACKVARPSSLFERALEDSALAAEVARQEAVRRIFCKRAKRVSAHTSSESELACSSLEATKVVAEKIPTLKTDDNTRTAYPMSHLLDKFDFMTPEEMKNVGLLKKRKLNCKLCARRRPITTLMRFSENIATTTCINCKNDLNNLLGPRQSIKTLRELIAWRLSEGVKAPLAFDKDGKFIGSVLKSSKNFKIKNAQRSYNILVSAPEHDKSCVPRPSELSQSPKKRVRENAFIQSNGEKESQAISAPYLSPAKETSLAVESILVTTSPDSTFNDSFS